MQHLEAPRILSAFCLATQETHCCPFGSSHYVAWMGRLMLSMIEEAWGFGGSQVAVCGEERESQAKRIAGLPVSWPSSQW